MLVFRNLSRHASRSALLVLAIAFVTALVALLQAQVAGLKQDIYDLIVRETVGEAQIISLDVTGKMQNFIFDEQARQKMLTSSPTLAYTQTLQAQAWLQKNQDVVPLQVIGKDSFFGKTIRGLTLSPTLCQLLHLEVGDSVALSPTPTEGKQVFVLQDIMSFPLPQAESVAILPLDATQRFAGVGKQVSSISLYTQALPTSVKQFVLTNDFTIRSWQQVLPEIVQMLALLQATFVLIAGVLFVLLGVAVGVVIVQNWYERLPEMRRLRILGMTRRQVWRMLVSELWVVWGVGFVVGVLLCLPVLAYLNAFPVSLPTDIGKGLQSMGFPTRLRFGWDWAVLGVPFLCIFALFNILLFIAYSFANRLKVYA